MALGWNEESLSSMLESSEERFRSTGKYNGVERLEMLEETPIAYEKMFSKLRGAIVNARESALNISASPIVKELGELCFVLYSPEGDSVVLSTGIMVHVHTMSDCIKYMIREGYETNPGIRDGDIFVNNDPQIGDVHNADVQTLVPIFWEGEIVGWAGCVTHILDNGASTPGSSAVGPTTRFEDGIDLPAMKCGEDDVLHRDYEIRCRRAVRTPTYWILDEKTRVAGCHMIREAVKEVIKAEGVDRYKQFIRESIEEGRRSFISRVREMMVPGEYESPGFMDIQFGCERMTNTEGEKDLMMHAPLKTRVNGSGSLEVSLDGANEWGYHSFNCTPSALQGAIWVVLTQTVMPNDKVNDGAYYATSLETPKGSWSNPGVSWTAHSDAWLFLVPAFAGFSKVLSRGFFARGYLEEVLAGYGLDGNTLQGGGRDSDGNEVAVSNFEVSCIGGGAGYARDGLDFASVIWNPEGDMGDVEAWEVLEPLLYLSRQVKTDTAGMGRQRGGSGYESLRMVWNVDKFKLQNIGNGAVFGPAGLFGGYPAAAGYRHNIHGTNLPETFDKRLPYPLGDSRAREDALLGDLVQGRVVRDQRGVTLPEMYDTHDLYLNYLRGGPGLGDPLDRKPEDVEGDLNAGMLSREFAERVYGVVVEKVGRTWVVDRNGTDARRTACVDDRKRRAVPTREWIAAERDTRVLTQNMIEPIRDMYRSSMEISPSWAQYYREFWELDENFTY